MTTTQTEVSGTPFPAAFAAGWYWHQIWQQQMYQLAFARAWAVVYGPQPIHIRVACLPRVLRN